MTTHDTTLHFAIGTLDDAHRFESATFAQDEGDKLCQEMMEIDGMKPLVCLAFHLSQGVTPGFYAAIYGAISKTHYCFLCTTNATGRIPGEV